MLGLTNSLIDTQKIKITHLIPHFFTENQEFLSKQGSLTKVRTCFVEADKLAEKTNKTSTVPLKTTIIEGNLAT